MKKYIVLGAFALLCILQFAAPLKLACEADNVRKNGEILKFKCESYDPYDIFRGRYIHLYPEDFTLPRTEESAYSIFFKESYCLIFEKGEDGFAKAVSYSKSEPNDTSLYLKIIRTSLFARSKEANGITFQMPFTKFFVNEKDADILDDFLRKNRSNQENCYIEVAILNGKYAVVEFYDDKGRSSRQMVEEERPNFKKPNTPLSSN